MADFPHIISGIAVSAAIPCVIENVEARSILPSLSMSGTQRLRSSTCMVEIQRLNFKVTETQRQDWPRNYPKTIPYSHALDLPTMDGVFHGIAGRVLWEKGFAAHHEKWIAFCAPQKRPVFLGSAGPPFGESLKRLTFQRKFA